MTRDPVAQAKASPLLTPDVAPREPEETNEDDGVWEKLGPNPFQQDQGRADERPVDWRAHVVARRPAAPFPARSCVVPIKPPADPHPAPPTFGRGEHNERRRQPGRVLERVGDPHDVERSAYWREFRSATVQTQAVHDGLKTQVTRFNHAERDKELRALMVMHPKEGWTGDLDDYVEAQQLPTRGGMSLGGLFDAKNQLVLSKHDRQSIDHVAQNTQRGRHGAKVEGAGYGAFEADNNFERTFFALKAAVVQSRAAIEGLTAAKARLKALAAAEEARRAQADIDKIKAEVATVVEAVEILTALVTIPVQFATENAGDGIEALGGLAAKLIGHIRHDEIAAAEARLENALDKGESIKRLAAQAEIRQARQSVHASKHTIEEKAADLRLSMTKRRQAYNNLGATAGRELDCPAQSRDRIAAILAAIPIAEYVEARAGVIASTADLPDYSDAAGRGYAMARAAKTQQLPEFIAELEEIAGCRAYFGHLERVWAGRVKQLYAVRQKVVGTRPGDD